MKRESDLYPNSLFSKLQTLGAGEFQHLNGLLIEHLHDTATLLRRWGADDKFGQCGTLSRHLWYGWL